MTHGTRHPRDLLIAPLGLAAAGAGLGWGDGLGAMLRLAVSLPAIILGTSALLLPALYIGAAFIGEAPPWRRVAGGVERALRAIGIALLGLAPAMTFVRATSSAPESLALLGSAGVGFGVLAGLFVLHRALFSELSSPRVHALFASWVLVATGIGGNLFLSALAR